MAGSREWFGTQPLVSQRCTDLYSRIVGGAIPSSGPATKLPVVLVAPARQPLGSTSAGAFPGQGYVTEIWIRFQRAQNGPPSLKGKRAFPMCADVIRCKSEFAMVRHDTLLQVYFERPAVGIKAVDRLLRLFLGGTDSDRQCTRSGFIRVAHMCRSALYIRKALPRGEPWFRPYASLRWLPVAKPDEPGVCGWGPAPRWVRLAYVQRQRQGHDPEWLPHVGAPLWSAG